MDSVSGLPFDTFAAFGPEWLLAGTIAFLLALIVIKAIPAWEKSRQKKLEIMETESKARIDLEQKREQRKSDEEAAREQRDRERSTMEGRWIEQNERFIHATEQTNTMIKELSQQLALSNEQLSSSKDRSAEMHKQVDRMADQVDDIHRHIVR